MKFPAGKFVLKDGSYTSVLTGLVRPGGVVEGPWALKRVLPDSFKAEKLSEVCDMSLRLEGGLGDKIYFLPLLNALGESVGAEMRDLPLFRAYSKPRLPKKVDIPVSIFLKPTFDKNLTDQYIKALGVEPALKIPILETTEEEKRSVDISEKYVVVCLRSSDPRRDVLTHVMLSYLKKNLSVRVVELTTRLLPEMLPLIEKAEAVLSVSTGVIPVAIGFQVPVIGCDERMCRNRINYSAEAFVCSPNVDKILSLLEDVLFNRFRCWCGGLIGTSVVEDNLWMIKCAECGTLRQDIKVSPLAFRSFLVKYGKAWVKDYVYVESSKDPFYFSSLISDVLGFKKVSSWLDIGSGSGAIKEKLPSYIRLATVDFDGNSDYTDISQVQGFFDVVSMINVIHFMDLWNDFGLVLNRLAFNGLLVIRGHVEQPTRFARFRYLFPLKEAWLLNFLRFHKFSVLHSSVKGSALTVIAKRL